MQAHDWFLSQGCFNGQDVEPPWSIFEAARANKLAIHARQVNLFFQIYGVFGGRLARFSFGACFHFDECGNRAILGDEVELAFDSRHGEVPRDHHVTLAAQVPVSVGFTANAGSARELFGG